MIELEPFDVLRRGHAHPASLDESERLVFAVMELEALADMEGWDHFFTSSPAFDLYEPMKTGLEAAGDRESLAVLADYERWLAANGVALSPQAIDGFLTTLSGDDLERLPDWRARFQDLTETRWQLIAAHLERRGVRLIATSPPDEES